MVRCLAWCSPLRPDDRDAPGPAATRPPNDRVGLVGRPPHHRLELTSGSPDDSIGGVDRAPHDRLTLGGRDDALDVPRALTISAATRRSPDDVGALARD